MTISYQAIPGVPLKHIRLEDEKLKLKGLRILSVCCQYFGTSSDTVLDRKSTKATDVVKTKKYYYYFLNLQLGLTSWFILKYKLSNNNKITIRSHIKDVNDKLSINDPETIKIVNEIKSYLE